jgi:hypothetical protein
MITMKKIFPLLLLLLTVAAQAQLVVQNGASLTTTGNALVCLLNTDLQNNGTINQLNGTGRFVFNGNVSSTISGATQPNFAILEMAKTGTAQLTLQQNIGVNENIIFTSGTIELNNKNILLAPTALLTGESETSRIIGTSGGYVEITNILNAPNATNLGNLGAVITSTQNLGSTTIRRGHVSQTTSGGVGSSLFRYFDITPTNNTALNTTLRINYFDAELNSQTESSLVQFKSANNINWANMGFTTRNATLNFVEKTGLADFSRWTLANFNNALPIVLTQFNVACANGNAVVQWKTAQELNSKEYYVQASNNATNWQTIATVSAAGNSTAEKQYSYTNTGTTYNFYRIAQIDINGTTTNSTIIKANCVATTIDYVSTYPNPVKDVLQIDITVASASTLQLKVIDEKGAVVLMQTTNVVKGKNILPVKLGQLAKANCTLQLVWNNGQSQKAVKLIKL